MANSDGIDYSMQYILPPSPLSLPSQVVRYLIILLSRLMAMFPTEPATAALASKLEELEPLYGSVVRIINDGLSNFEKSATLNTVPLHCVLMILKAACNNDPCYIDRYIYI